MIKNLRVNTGKGFSVNKKKIHNIVSELKKTLNFSIISLDVNFVGSDYILEINKKYLNHHYSTDIITFNYSGETDNLDGEIYISLPDAAANSKKYAISVDLEALRLVIHGILHMLGYDDMNLKDKKIMKRLENTLVLQLKNAAKNLIWKL